MYVYPVKSCGGLGVTRWYVGKAGLFLDRAFMLVDTQVRVGFCGERFGERLSLCCVDLCWSVYCHGFL